MDSKTRKFITTPLSPNDVKRKLKKMTGKEINIVYLQKVKPSDSINEILGVYNCCVVFIPVKNVMSGHWVSVFRKKDGSLWFFDSYGKTPSMIADLVRMNNGYQSPDTLWKKLFSSGKSFANTTDFQGLKKEIADCGDWSALNLSLFLKYGDKYTFNLMDAMLRREMAKHGIGSYDVMLAKIMRDI